MVGEDLASVRFAPPPLPPFATTDIDRDSLIRLGESVSRRMWTEGLSAWFWGEGVCLLGMIRFAAAVGAEVPQRAVDWLEEYRRAGVAIKHVNDLAPATATVLVSAGRPALREFAVELGERFEDLRATRAPNGALEHWPGAVWADTTFMAALFLGHLGELTRRPELVAELEQQLLAHAEVLQDASSGLFAHGSHAGSTIWSFWGRANAWCALTAVEYLELAARSPDLVNPRALAAINTSLARQLTRLAELQPHHGVWSVLVDEQPENAGIIETSAAAGIGAAMLRAAPHFPHRRDLLLTAGWRAIRGALAYVGVDGTLNRVSAGTVLQLIPFGYSVIRDDRIQPWGQGLALHAIAAALDATARGDGPR